MSRLGLEFKNVKLVHYSKEYFDFVYDCYQDYDSIHLFSNFLEIKSKNEFWDIFVDKLKKRYLEFMIILNKENNIPVGFIYSYDYNIVNQTVYIAICICKEKRKNIYGVLSGIIYFNYLFKTKPIRKVYCAIYSFNKECFEILSKIGFLKEGNLKKHRYYNGEYYDTYIMSLTRNNLYEFMGDN